MSTKFKFQVNRSATRQNKNILRLEYVRLGSIIGNITLGWVGLG